MHLFKKIEYPLAVFLGLLACLCVVNAGDYEVTTTSVTLSGGVLQGSFGPPQPRTFPVDIHYPTASCEEEDGCVAISNETFPGVLLLVNFNGLRSNYRLYARALAAEGYVVTVAEGMGLVAPMVRTVAPRTVTATVEYLVANAAALNLQADNMALIGHSFGASTAFVFASASVPSGYCTDSFGYLLCAGITNASDPQALVGNRFKSVLGLGASRDYFDFSTRTTINVTFDTVLPIGFLFGTEDRTVEVSRRDDAYASGVNAPKALFIINGTGHFGMMNDFVPPPSSREIVPYFLDQEVSIEHHVYVTNVFLRANLKNNEKSYERIFVTKDIKGPRGVSVLRAEA